MHQQPKREPKRTAELVASALRMRAGGATYRQIGAELAVDHTTAARWITDAIAAEAAKPAAQIAAAVRDHRQVVLDRVDEVWNSQQPLDTPAAASVALSAAALEARTFVPSLAPAVRQITRSRVMVQRSDGSFYGGATTTTTETDGAA